MTQTRPAAAAIAVLASLALTAALLRAAPGGDLNKQRPTYHIDHIPPAPVLTPAEELKTFKLPAGFHAELVAAEPMVEEPIALTFDPDGRMYVVELRAYMPDLAGSGELDPIGRIVRLESSAGNGTFDRRTVFLDKLSIPRAVGLAGDGVIVAEPPTVWFCRDTKGDGTCTEKKEIFTDFGSRSPNPEHMANGLTWAMDNWYYSANWSARFRYSKGQFIREGTPSRGQWGIAQDDVGRLFYNSNSSMLRCDLAPAQYLMRNPYLGNPAGLNVAIASNATFPARVNPGVNRGYTADLNAEGKLQRVTAACGPTIYRADQFPAEYQGNAFVCEPAGNLVSRQVLQPEGVAIKAKGVQHDGVDFLTSTDERFRPVSLYTGPDGALYVVDIYHGILQHKAYVSAYLSDQIKQRNLEENKGHRGRIWRIVADGAKPAAWPKLAKAPTAALVAALSSPNGWWRDTAQRLLVEQQDKAAVKLLNKVVAGTASDTTPLGKVQALWALAGMDKAEDDAVSAAAQDADPRVRLTALRVGEVLVKKHLAPQLEKLLTGLANDPDPLVQLQVLMMGSPELPEQQAALNAILVRHLDDPVFRSAALNGATGREMEFLQALLADRSFIAAGPAKDVILNDMAESVIRSRSAERIERLLQLIAAQPAGTKSAQEALMRGVAEAFTPPAKGAAPRKLRLPAEPAAMPKLLASADPKVAAAAKAAVAAMSWPGKPGDTTPPLKPLTADQQQRFAAGHELFTAICAACHQPSGLGMDGVAPPLVDSEWVLGPEARVSRIVLNGLHGPIKVGKKTVDMEMPGLRALEDEQVASVLTYLRREWGHEANPVDPALVARVRKETEDRGDAQWTAEELAQIK